MTDNTMLASFHFRVHFSTITGITDADTRFESVTGIGAARQNATPGTGMQQIATLFQPLVLRRALPQPENAGLHQWVQQCIRTGNYPILPEVTVTVLGAEQQPVIKLVFKNVLLKSWQLSELHALKDGILMEEMQFEYKAVAVLSA